MYILNVIRKLNALKKLHTHYIYIYIYIKNIAVNLFSKLGWELGLYYASYDDFHPDILARMYT